MQKKSFLYIFSLLTLLSSACKDEFEKCDEDLQCEYFYCEVNGEKWEANCEAGPIFGCNPIDLQYYRNTSKNIELTCKNQKNNESFRLLINKVIENNIKNILFDDENSKSKFGIIGSNDDCNIYFQDSLAENSFYVTEIDTNNFIIKAEINATFINKCNERKTLSKGKLKAQYRF